MRRDSASLYDAIRPEEVMTDTGGEKSVVGSLCVKRQVEKSQRHSDLHFYFKPVDARRVLWLTIGRGEEKFFCLQISRYNLLIKKSREMKKQIQQSKLAKCNV